MKRKIVILTAIMITVTFAGTYLIFGTGQNGGSKTVTSAKTDLSHDELVETTPTAPTENGQAAALQEELQIKNEIEEESKGAREEEIAKISALSGLSREGSMAVLKYAEQFDLKPSLLLAIMKEESNFYQYAVGRHQDRGYFQIIPPSEKAIAQKWGEQVGISYDPDKIFEPDYNIGLAAVYIHSLQSKYKGNLHRVLSEYNRGPGNLQAYFEENGTYQTPYSESVLNLEKKYSKSLS